MKIKKKIKIKVQDIKPIIRDKEKNVHSFLNYKNKQTFSARGLTLSRNLTPLRKIWSKKCQNLNLALNLFGSKRGTVPPVKFVREQEGDCPSCKKEKN